MCVWSGPPPTPPLETHFFEVFRGVGGGAGFGGDQKCSPLSWVENHESFGLFFFDFEPKKCFRVPTPYALFSHFCYAGGFGDLGDPVVPTLRDVSGDVVTVCAY